ncbi:MAG: hypothetical protein QXS20_04360 [Candidatus Thorarchaeota archaeon]
MVSRSLEKMMLIAIGLSTVVIVAAPILLYSMGILSTASRLETAREFAVKVHEYVTLVDSGESSSVLTQLIVPTDVKVSSVGKTLIITFEPQGAVGTTWSKDYSTGIVLIGPDDPGVYLLRVWRNDLALYVEFS